MKKEKLLVKEIDVLSSEISKKVNVERRKLLDEKVKKDKEYVGLMKKVDEYNKKLKEMRKMEESFIESIKKIEKRLGLGSSWDGNKIGYLSSNSILGGSYRNSEFGVSVSVNCLGSSEVYNKLMIENIDGDLKVNDLIDRMVKEFIK